MKFGIIAIASGLILWSGGAEFSAHAGKESFARTKPHGSIGTIGPIDHTKNAARQVGRIGPGFGTAKPPAVPTIGRAILVYYPPRRPDTSHRALLKKPDVIILDEPISPSTRAPNMPASRDGGANSLAFDLDRNMGLFGGLKDRSGEGETNIRFKPKKIDTSDLPIVTCPNPSDAYPGC
jgi:hypothetical protein